MKKFLLCCVSLLALVACDNKKNLFICGDYEVEINMSEDGEQIATIINGDGVTLNHAISASGVRYVGELNETVITLWNKGEDWTLFFNDGMPIYCVAK